MGIQEKVPSEYSFRGPNVTLHKKVGRPLPDVDDVDPLPWFVGFPLCFLSRFEGPLSP